MPSSDTSLIVIIAEKSIWYLKLKTGDNSWKVYNYPITLERWLEAHVKKPTLANVSASSCEWQLLYRATVGTIKILLKTFIKYIKIHKNISKYKKQILRKRVTNKLIDKHINISSLVLYVLFSYGDITFTNKIKTLYKQRQSYCSISFFFIKINYYIFYVLFIQIYNHFMIF